jgi:hypothetical protein
VSRGEPRRKAPAPVDWAKLQYVPTGAPVRRCDRRGCGAAYTDDEAGRLAHIRVFDHSPRPPEPASPPKENPP